MDKLLHERLRDNARLKEAYTLLNNGKKRAFIDSAGMMNLADEIERYYIPRPRFEDGEPVQFGEEFESRNDGNKYTANFIGRGSNGVGRVASCKNGCGMTAEEPLKRPTPKVYDADGVEIKVGDTVFNVNSGNGGIVTGFDPCELIEVEAHDGGHWKNSGNNLTHDKPVFDAEGVRICKGDTVWTIGTGIECEVTGFDSLEDSIRVNTKEINSDHTGLIAPCLLTHSEPDSFNKAMERFQSILEDKDGLGYETEEKLWEVHKRLTALIERGA